MFFDLKLENTEYNDSNERSSLSPSFSHTLSFYLFHSPLTLSHTLCLIFTVWIMFVWSLFDIMLLVMAHLTFNVHQIRSIFNLTRAYMRIAVKRCVCVCTCVTVSNSVQIWIFCARIFSPLENHCISNFKEFAVWWRSQTIMVQSNGEISFDW